MLNDEINFILKKIIALLKKEKKFKNYFKKFNYPEIIIASPALMRKLEKEFFNKDKEPDILSFNWPKNFIYPQKKPPLGEIYLNKNIIKKKDYLKYLLVHGVLHLLGFDHKKKNDIIKMEKKEKEILKGL
jgi:probable rRNA maturation factor